MDEGDMIKNNCHHLFSILYFLNILQWAYIFFRTIKNKPKIIMENQGNLLTN